MFKDFSVEIFKDVKSFVFSSAGFFAYFVIKIMTIKFSKFLGVNRR